MSENAWKLKFRPKGWLGRRRLRLSEMGNGVIGE